MSEPQAPKEGGSSLFRQKALEHLLAEDDAREPLKVSPPWTWSIFWVIASVIGVSLVVAVFGKVEMQESGRGIIRPTAGVRQLQALVSGTVEQTYARSGDSLKAGQPILRIKAAQLESSLVETDSQLKLLKSEGRVFAAHEQGLTLDQIKSVKGKIAAQESQVESCKTAMQIQKDTLKSHQRLFDEGLLSKDELNGTKLRLNAAQREFDASCQQLVQLKQELTSLESQKHRTLWQQTQELQGAESRRKALDSTLSQMQVLAPVDGSLEALITKPGDLVQVGQTLAKLIPEGSPLQVVAFIPEKNRSFVKPGDGVLLELDAYPYAEFGTLKGKIRVIGSDLASPYEVREALGEEARLESPAVRVEIDILDERPSRLAKAVMRSGMLLQARFTLRRVRIITLVLEPLKRWLE